jgi:hypothetical protein
MKIRVLVSGLQIVRLLNYDITNGVSYAHSLG